MKTRWILVADASRGRVISTVDRATTVSELQDLINPEGRMRTQELVSDQSGRIEKSRSGTLSTMDPPTDAHEEAAKRFAHQLAAVVEKGLEHKAFVALTLVAPAHFLGLLKAALSVQATKKLDGAIAKDLTRMSAPELREHLHQIMEQLPGSPLDME